MRPHTWIVAATFWLPACGPELIPLAEQERVCGQEGPVRLLEGTAGDAMSFWIVQTIGDRLVVSTGDYLDDRQSEIWSVGRCGEDPRLVARDLWLSNLSEAPVDHVIACDTDADEVFLLDPSEQLRDAVLLPGVGCLSRWSTLGPVGVRDRGDGLGVAELWIIPEDPFATSPTSRVVADGVRLADPESEFFQSVREPSVAGGALFAINEQDALIRVDLSDGTTTVVADNVRAFDAFATGVLWQTMEVTGGSEATPHGPVFVLDHDTGVTTYLMDTALQYGSPSLRSKDGVGLRTAENPEGEIRFFDRLPATDYVTLPGDEFLFQKIGERRWVIGTLFGAQRFIVDFATGERRVFLSQAGQRVLADPAVDDDAWTILATGDVFLAGPPWRKESPIFRVPFDGPRQKLAERATWLPTRMPEGRIATRVDVGRDDRGSLIIVEPDTLEERLVDDAVVSRHGLLSGEPDDVVYWVDDGARSGLWRARLAPRP